MPNAVLLCDAACGGEICFSLAKQDVGIATRSFETVLKSHQRAIGMYVNLVRELRVSNKAKPMIPRPCCGLSWQSKVREQKCKNSDFFIEHWLLRWVVWLGGREDCAGAPLRDPLGQSGAGGVGSGGLGGWFWARVPAGQDGRDRCVATVGHVSNIAVKSDCCLAETKSLSSSTVCWRVGRLIMC